MYGFKTVAIYLGLELTLSYLPRTLCNVIRKLSSEMCSRVNSCVPDHRSRLPAGHVTYDVPSIPADSGNLLCQQSRRLSILHNRNKTKYTFLFEVLTSVDEKIVTHIFFSNKTNNPNK